MAWSVTAGTTGRQKLWERVRVQDRQADQALDERSGLAPLKLDSGRRLTSQEKNDASNSRTT